MVSSAFVVWQGKGDSEKSRLVVNLKRQSRHWKKGTVKMETLPGFALELHERDELMSFDVKGGYRHLYLRPEMRDFFVFRYNGRFYRCIALPFGWGRSGYWFVKLMRPVVQHMREKMGFRVLPYIDDFLVVPSAGGVVATKEHSVHASKEIDRLLVRLGMTQHMEKGCWKGSMRLDHLGTQIDTVAMKLFVADRKVALVRRLASKILELAQKNCRLVPMTLLRHFCGVCVSLTLGFPMARFYTRSIYFDMSLSARREREERAQSPQRREAKSTAAEGFGLHRQRRAGRGHYRRSGESGRVRLCRQSMRDLDYWRSLARGEGRDLFRLPVQLTMHSDAADVGYGGTLGLDERQGSPGSSEDRGFWTTQDRGHSITLRELRAVRLLLHRHFCGYVSDRRVRKILMHKDNLAVVHILNAMVSASKPIMVELRKLEVLMRVQGIRLEARWIPSAVNKYADSLSRTWDPGDVRATASLCRSIDQEYKLDRIVFRDRPLGETYVARRKYVATQMNEDWGDRLARLWNPPFNFLPLVVRKIEMEGGRGVLVAPHWPAQAWFARLKGLSSQIRLLDGDELGGSPHMEGDRTLNDQWRMMVAEIGC